MQLKSQAHCSCSGHLGIGLAFFLSCAGTIQSARLLAKGFIRVGMLHFDIQAFLLPLTYNISLLNISNIPENGLRVKFTFWHVHSSSVVYLITTASGHMHTLSQQASQVCVAQRLCSSPESNG